MTAEEWRELWNDHGNVNINDLINCLFITEKKAEKVENEKDELKRIVARAKLCEENANSIIFKLRKDNAILREKLENL